MNTKVLLFSVDHFDRSELEQLNDKEKYELACAAEMFDCSASVLSPSLFSSWFNNELISVDNSWLYFVDVE